MYYVRKLNKIGHIALPQGLRRNMGLRPDDAVRIIPLEDGVALLSAAGPVSALDERDIAALESDEIDPD